MHEKTVNVPTADGSMETFVVHPEEGGPFAPVVVYMDVWGLREELCDIARKIAVVGYYVMLPDLYYRQGRVRHQWRDAQGRMISLHNLDPERQAKVRAPLQQLSDAMVVWQGAVPVRRATMGGRRRYISRRLPVRRTDHLPRVLRREPG